MLGKTKFIITTKTKTKTIKNIFVKWNKAINEKLKLNEVLEMPWQLTEISLNWSTKN